MEQEIIDFDPFEPVTVWADDWDHYIDGEPMTDDDWEEWLENECT